MPSLDQVLSTIDGRRDQAVAALSDFLRIPSVSTKPEHQPDMLRCATWLADQLKFGGLDVAIMPTGGHPIVVAKNNHQPGRPTVLLYGHYDVQPAEPLELWTTGPFEPTVRKDDMGHDALFARGAVDDKGQVWAHVEAILAWQAHGGLPINLTMLVEGEEEIGSEHLEAFVKQHAEQLRADVAVVSDTNQFARGVPAITYGLRGLAYMELIVTGPSHDLHSGLYGGAVPNPANVLARLIASLHDQQGRVDIPGFYDDVTPLSPQERAQWRALPFSEKEFAASVGLSEGTGEAGYTSLERKWARPTCDVNGITTGYQGPGAKTVIPSKASAKISMRLVPNQNPARIVAGFETAMRERAPKNVKIDVTCHSHTPGVVVPIEGDAMRLAAEAMEIGFGKTPALMREGGSIPVVNLLKRVLGVDTLLLGFGLPDDRVHSPNEKFYLDALHKGARTAGALYEKLTQLQTSR